MMEMIDLVHASEALLKAAAAGAALAIAVGIVLVVGVVALRR